MGYDVSYYIQDRHREAVRVFLREGADDWYKACREVGFGHVPRPVGFLEGEGSFMVHSTRSVTAKQKQREPLEKLRSILGGVIYQEATGMHTWVTGGHRAYGIMLTVFTLMSTRRRKQIYRATGPYGLRQED